MQFDLFGSTLPTTSPIGLTLSLSRPCDCGATATTIGASCGPHYGSLHCRNCGRFRSWISRETHRFVVDIIDRFGRPGSPIMATMPSADTL
jgi:hypothetical protein